MRKLSRIIILFAVAILCALWAPWNAWNLNIPGLLGISSSESVSNLQVSSLAGEIEVYIDDDPTPKATATPDASAVIPGIAVGSHQVRLVRKSNVEGAYWSYNRVIEFVPNVDVILAYELGPTKEFSGGHLIYAQSGAQEDTGSKVELAVTANVDEAAVAVNDNLVGQTPITNYTLGVDAQQRLSITKPGYESQQFLLFPEDTNEREKLAGYKLLVEVDLFLQPLPVEKN